MASDGSGPADVAVSTSGKVLTDATYPTAKNTWTISATGRSSLWALPINAQSLTVFATGTHVGWSANVQGSHDGGTSWYTLAGKQVGSSIATMSGGFSGLAGAMALSFELPPGLTHISLNTTALTSGTATAVAIASAAADRPVMSMAGQVQPLAAAGSLGDATTSGNMFSVGGWVYNGTNWDRVRSAESAQGTSGTGLAGSGMLLYSTTGTWQRLQTLSSAATDGLGGIGSILAGLALFNGTTFDRARAFPAADAVATTGYQGVGLLGVSAGGNLSRIGVAAGSGDASGGSNIIGSGNWVYNGTNWDRQRSPSGATTGSTNVAGDSNVQSGVSSALNSVPVGAIDVRSYRWVSVQLVGDATSNQVVTFEQSNDNTNWSTVGLFAVNGGGQSSTVTIGNSVSAMFHGPLTGRFFRARTSTYTAGSVTGTAIFSAMPSSTIPALAQGNSMIGYMSARGAWYDDTTTPLAIGATYTGATRDITGGGGAGATFNNTASLFGTKEVRFEAISDQPGTLAIEVSLDSTTWRRVREQPTSAGGTGGLHVAQIQVLPARRYLRAVYVNGATAQTHFSLSTMMFGA